MSIAHIMHKIASDVARLGHTTRFDQGKDILWIDGLGLKVHAIEPHLANRVSSALCAPSSGNDATSTIHMVSARDPRVSACGHWWWSGGGIPARILRDVTCNHCKYTRDYKGLGLDMNRPLDREPKR